MKRTMIIMLTVGMLVAFAMPASAKKGGGKSPWTNTRTCQDLIDNGATGWSDYEYDSSNGVYTVTFTVPGAVCIDIAAGEGPWSIKVDTDGSRSGLLMEIKDSMPGDVCWSQESRTTVPSATYSPDLKASATNVCGTEYPDLSPGGYKTSQYVFYAGGTGHKPLDHPITITVTPPPLQSKF